MKSRIPLLLFSLLGLGASLTSTYVHYNLLIDRSFSSFCDVNATVSCTQAYLSSYRSSWVFPLPSVACSSLPSSSPSPR